MFKIGDKVNITDRSYTFGFADSELSLKEPPHSRMKNLVVVASGLNVVRSTIESKRSSSNMCDVIVKDGKGGWWFVPSDQLQHATHTVSFDGETAVTLSNESFQNLKKAFTKE